ncbi:unnamed protein product [Hermetia illucens]|uniref:Peptidase S1 domain-containing protein n=1 Tax=Hermetia illucens TaxID=343691 RepID=A0A7R8UGF3_HERIL|nr:unnamed protein product [Hermetia illucens]
MSKSWIFYVLFILVSSSREIHGLRIISGADVERGKYPYVVSLQVKYEGRHLCGGTLLTPKSIISAAYCVQDQIPTYLIVLAGVINTAEWRDGYQTSGIHSVHTPGEYPNPTNANDLAILLMWEAFKESPFVGSLPFEQINVSVASRVVIVHWRFVTAKEWILHYTNAEIDELDICGTNVDSESFMCAISDVIVAGKELPGCPLFYREKIVGVASMKSSSGDTGIFYSKLSFYNSWIRSILGMRTFNGGGSQIRQNLLKLYICIKVLVYL